MNKLIYLKKFLFLGMVLVFTITAWAQTGSFKNGVKQGQIKVKFTPEMTTSLSQVTVNARTSGFTTGIQSVDQVAKTTKASNMYRMFPYDPKFEHKLRKHGLHLWYVVLIDETTDPKTAVSQFKQLNEVAVAEVEHEKVLAPYSVVAHTPTASPNAVLPFNDPMLKDQWHYDNSGQLGIGNHDANVFSAWQVTTGASNVIVSVHDQGVDVNHADLKANIWVNQAEKNGQPGVDDDGNGYIDDINGYNFQKNNGAIDPENHGTHVAGTIAAVNNNGIGVSGIAGGNGSGNGVKVMSLQILGGAPIEKSYVYAANNGAVISQNSWGYSNAGYFDQSVKEAIDYFVAEAGDYDGSPMRGGIVLFAAGNNNYDAAWYPGYYSSTFSVASTGPEGKKAYYSNFGTWVEISAPGGDQSDAYDGKGGVLSTIPKDMYAYMQGTSMACPHVSGIAALAVANRTKQLTNTELWSKLLTGVNNVYAQNPNHLGKLGSGAIDALKAISNDQGKKPAAIQNLNATDIAQEFAKLTWTVPADEDDAEPFKFTIYYSKNPITAENAIAATKITIKNDSVAGKPFAYEVTGLYGLTNYYFIVTSTDRWGNESLFSNELQLTTNEGPAIAVIAPATGTQNSPTWIINTLTSTTGSQPLTIQNSAAGLLRYTSFVRPLIVTNPSTPTSGGEEVIYPAIPTASGETKIGTTNGEDDGVAKLFSNEPAANAYTTITKNLINGNVTTLIGDTDTTLPNSAAARFNVTETGGFNLTRVTFVHRLTRAATVAEPIVVEIYKGGVAPVKANLLLAQNYTTTNLNQTTASINLSEQLYFAQGESFWVVFHVPNGNLFPLGMGYEADPANSLNCLYSSNVGTTWMSFEEAINDKNYAWGITAFSANAPISTFISLSPASGDISGMTNTVATINADASQIINANYGFNVVLASNDGSKPELRVPVYVKVQNHQPKVKMVNLVDFNSVFVGSTKSFDVVMENQGYGIYTIPSPFSNYVLSGANANQFVVETTPSRPSNVQARDQATFRVTFKPTVVGTANATLTVTGRSANNTPYVYTISLFGVASQTSTIALTPETQVKTPVTIGDEVPATVTVQNTGGFPLKYFIPGFDTKGVSENWPSAYHKYGYKFRTNYGTEVNPITYSFQDIKTTGIDITSQLLTDRKYATVDMGFDFPYYDKVFSTIYVAQKGFTTFDNTVQPLNSPGMLGNAYSPKGYISVLGTFLSFSAQGQVLYKKEADRLIIQYENVTDGYMGSFTAQMVLFNNGDIRFYYKYMDELSVSERKYLNILIEDYDKKDGILVHNFSKNVVLNSGTALGFDYPGPNIIKSITNGSGIVAPGASVNVDVVLKTATLVEGITKRYINFISNDPLNSPKNVLIELDITSGGIARPFYSANAIAFGNVFEGAIRSQVLTLKDTGTASVNITSMVFTNGQFSLSGEAAPLSVKPGLYKEFTVTIPTNVITSLEDDLVITYADNSTHTIHVTGNVVPAPAISADLTAITEVLNYKETKSLPYSIQNTGAAPLEVSITGKQWVTFDAATAPASVTYEWEKHNTGGVYQWIDIRKTGVQLPVAEDLFDPAYYWREIELPFEFEYYGTKYTKIKLGENGIASFDTAPPVMYFPGLNIPTGTDYEGSFIMPYWMFGGLSGELGMDPKDFGLFYQAFDDKIIITWSHLVNNFGGMGDPISTQMFLYKNGTIKFQYRVELFDGGDQTSQFTLIGLQKNSTDGIFISPKIALDYGTSTGLAYVMVPEKKHMVAAGGTLSGDINLNSWNIYGGTYNTNLKIKSNAPNNELQLKPVQLTVNGLAVYGASKNVHDFGTKMINNPSVTYDSIYIKNDGSAPMQITNVEMKAGKTQANPALNLQVWAFIAGWFGSSWQWADVSGTNFGIYGPGLLNPVLTVPAQESILVRGKFGSNTPGEYKDTVLITTNVGVYKIALSGILNRAPGLVVTTTPINESMNTLTEMVTRKIPFSATNTNNGQGNLEYSIGIEFGRATASSSFVETISTTQSSSVQLNSIEAKNNSVSASAVTAYNRVISHTNETVPSTFIGTGGSAPFTVATKYNSGSNGFSISHVETYFRPETLTSGKIIVEVRAGGTSVATASKVAEGSFSFTASGSDNQGMWVTIPLDKVGGIYPNEDFYILVTNPLGVQYPQGVVTDATTTGKRYYFYDIDLSQWHDLNDYNQFKTYGWLMRAAEQTAGVTSWLNITSALSGSLTPGVLDTVRLTIDGHYAMRGDQIANIVLTTNDPLKVVTKVPVSLHVNEAPHFAAYDVLYVSEGGTATVEIAVTDKEGNTFSTQAAQAYAGVSSTLANGKLAITVTPDYETAGTHYYTFTATDSYNATREIALHVEVAHTNRAPEYIGASEPLAYTASGEVMEYVITDFFADPDEDTYTYSVASLDVAIAQVFTANDKFIVRPMTEGETALSFVVTDSHGASMTHTVDVSVTPVLGIEDNDVNFSITTYPNPSKGKVQIHIDGEIASEYQVRIINSMGSTLLVKKNVSTSQDGQVDLSSLQKGIYFIEISDSRGRSTRRIVKE